MAERLQEVLKVTYQPNGQEPISIEIPRAYKRFRQDETSKMDAKVIAETIMQLKPGVNELDQTGISVERIHEGTDRMLYGWKNKVEEAFRQEAHALTHNSITRAPELQQVRLAALQEGTDMQRRNRKRRHADPFFVPGRKRAEFVAWDPIFSSTIVERVGSALINEAVSDVNVQVNKIGKWKLAYRFKKPLKHTFHLENPFLTPGLGRDDKDMIHELGPDQPIEHMQKYLSGLLRRMQDRELDPADIVHGVGKKLVNIIEEHQAGLSGLGLTLAETEFPIVREAIDAVMSIESLTSADKEASKFALIAYSRADNRVFDRKKSPKNTNQDEAQTNTSEGESQKKQSFAQRALAEVESEIRAQFDWSPKAVGRSLRNKLTETRHRLVWYPSNVFADQLDKRSETQDEVALAYVKTVLSTTGGSPAFDSYRRALATAFANALTAPRTKGETFNRKLSGESSELEQIVEKELMNMIPRYWQDVIRKGLTALEGRKAKLPEPYKASLLTLKEHETTDSYLEYIKYLYPLTVTYTSTDETNPLAGKDYKALRELWRQAKEYTEYLDSIRATAHNVLFPTTQPEPTEQPATTQLTSAEAQQFQSLLEAAGELSEIDNGQYSNELDKANAKLNVAQHHGYDTTFALENALRAEARRQNPTNQSQ